MSPAPGGLALPPPAEPAGRAMMNDRLFLGALLLALLLTRLCHVGILWPEDTLPIAAAAHVQAGFTLYRDVWFDKPPLLALAHLLWGARPGVPMRVAGALYAWLCCLLAFGMAWTRWGGAAARYAAGALAFFLTFDTPAAVHALAADLLMLAPHLAAVWLAMQGRPFAAGALAGVAFALNAKGLFVLAAAALFAARAGPFSVSPFPLARWVSLAAGFAAPNLALFAWLWFSQAWPAYLEQVWYWPRLYAADTFVAHPLMEGLRRTANWAGFHLAILIPAGYVLGRGLADRWKFSAWLLLSFAAVCLGLRFFPRYYFQALPVICVLAGAGFARLPGRARAAVALLALVPLLRFGPRYALLARDLLAGRAPAWSDVAMDQDSRQAAALLRQFARPGDTLFVWGFRPELYVYSGLRAGTPFLESQPLTGVPADRHLFDEKSLMPAGAAARRARLLAMRPTFICEGLGLYNPRLAIGQYPDLAAWMRQYRLRARTAHTLIYERISAGEEPPAGSAL
jgi:hypothetical protein